MNDGAGDQRKSHRDKIRSHRGLEIQEGTRVKGQQSYLRSFGGPVDEHKRESLSPIRVIVFIRQDDEPRSVFRQFCTTSAFSTREIESELAETDTPSTRSSMEISSNCSTSSMISFCLLTLITSAALPEFRRANLNFRRESLTDWGISTVWDYIGSYDRECC